MDNGGPLKSGAKIAVIGGGPAGSFFAMLALKLAREMGKDINILIFDNKHFSDHGPGGCNMCAGVIQDSLITKLKGIGITLPSDIKREDIEGYSFHLRGLSACIKKDPSTSIYSVFRGGGPYGWSVIPRKKVSFDQYLLDHAIKEGVKFRHERVSAIEFPKRGESKVSVICKSKNNGKVYEADFVVGAFGVNTVLIKKLPFGYRPPKRWNACQAEIEMDREHMKERCGNMIHIFFTRSPKIKYLAITPKGDNATITAIGKNVGINDLQNEIINSEINEYLPRDWEFICHCHPRLPTTPARQPYSDRCVIIGDASYSRHMKNGIESAFYTAQFAAETILKNGISKEILKKNYDKRCRKMFYYDNLAGKILFLLHEIISSNNISSTVYLDRVIKEQSHMDPKHQKVSKLLWHLYTGDMPYRYILKRFFNPVLHVQFAYETIKKIFKWACAGP